MDFRESECLSRCLQGHVDEYRLIVERYQAPLVSWLTGRLRNRLEAEEVAHEAFVRAWLGLRRFRAGDPFFPWLCGIAAQVSRERHRTSGRRDRHEQQAAAERYRGRDGDVMPVSAGNDEPDLELRSAIDALPDALRSVVLLRYYGSFSCSEVAELLGVPIGTVTKQLSRAHARLRELLLDRDRRGERARNEIGGIEHDLH